MNVIQKTQIGIMGLTALLVIGTIGYISYKAKKLVDPRSWF